ncbi:hypothetical protein RJ640_000361 [Escallonia rubra]|uniref:PGG domain-containing protein n=1 Tax=Escallonia rubra TaxID=112253 RepID=A0AA88UD97_9ASTE|nr:hypothetical protein RJ640_000361 [Escallonia rubra]
MSGAFILGYRSVGGNQSKIFFPAIKIPAEVGPRKLLVQRAAMVMVDDERLGGSDGGGGGSEAQAVESDLSYYRPLLKAVVRGDWKAAERFFDQDKDAVLARISVSSETAVQISAATGKGTHFLEKLVDMMPPETLLHRSKTGDTALSFAAAFGNTKAVTALVEKNPSSLYIRTQSEQLPLHLAAEFAHKDTLLYLLSVTKEDVGSSPPFAGQSGVELLVGVIKSGFFDIALDLVMRFPDLALVNPRGGDSPLTAISRKASAFRSGIPLKFWEKLIYYCERLYRTIQHFLIGAPIILENCSNNQNVGDIEDPADTSQGLTQMVDRIRLLQVPHINDIRHKKLVHNQALQLVKCLCNKMEFISDDSELMRHVEEAVILAARLNVHEVVEEIVDTFPQAILLYSHENISRGIFQIAILNRSEKVFNLIYQMGEHKQFMNMVTDSSENNILHLAGILAPLHKLNLTSGAALQMQRELQWFKEVEKFVKPAFKDMPNSNKETPAMVFTKEHKDLVKEGEKWMKETATSCSIAAALIVTIVFAAAITVPGGNNQDSGYPIFSGYQAFMIFAVSDTISLFTSVTSLLMFLSILTARYAEEEFLYALPKRLIIGLLTLFLAITSMIIAFGATVYLVFGEREVWVLVPVAAFAWLPVSSFLFSQTPLLVQVISSTYGRGIFGKQSDRSLITMPPRRATRDTNGLHNPPTDGGVADAIVQGFQNLANLIAGGGGIPMNQNQNQNQGQNDGIRTGDVEKFKKLVPVFKGEPDPEKAEAWVNQNKKVAHV